MNKFQQVVHIPQLKRMIASVSFEIFINKDKELSDGIFEKALPIKKSA